MAIRDYTEKEPLARASGYIAIAIIIGAVCGLSSVLLGWAVDASSSVFAGNQVLVYVLPFAGIATVILYQRFGVPMSMDMNDVVSSMVDQRPVPIALAPSIFIGTCFTVLCGGSVGVGGAAMQMGGAIGSNLGRLQENGHRGMFIACGISGALCGLFFTPLASTMFAFELSRYRGRRAWHFVPIFLSAIIAYAITRIFYKGTRFVIEAAPAFSLDVFWKVIVVILAASLASAIFCGVLHLLRLYIPKLPGAPYAGLVIGGMLIIAITGYFGSNPYDGPGREQVITALVGAVRPDAFFWKAALTLLAIGFGYKGGMIMPTFCIGALLGNTVGTALGLDPQFAAAVGLVAMFCASTNCPIASFFAGIEFMGLGGMGYYALASGMAFLLTSRYSIYSMARYPGVLSAVRRYLPHRGGVGDEDYDDVDGDLVLEDWDGSIRGTTPHRKD